MNANPAQGVILHWIGGLAAASFYLPYKGVKQWSWETYWLVGGLFSWIVAPALFSTMLVPHTWHLIAEARASTLAWTAFFGLVWGIGGLTFGLTVRYLGLALGYSLALGCCAAFGTLIPPIFDASFAANVLGTSGGRIVLAGVATCLVGIAISGLAGMFRERELSAEGKPKSVAEFHFSKGVVIAMFCGITSAAMAFALAAGTPLAELSKAALLSEGRMDIWQNLPVLVVVLWGGFLTNCVWCAILAVRNRSGGEYVGRGVINREAHSSLSTSREDEAAAGGNTITAVRQAMARQTTPSPLGANYVLSAAAGVIWYLQFFFYSMGAVKMGVYGFSSWTLHMASIVIFATLWGVALREWQGTSRKTQLLVASGLLALVGSTVIIGYGNFLQVH